MQKYFKISKTEDIYDKITETFKERDEWCDYCRNFAKDFGGDPIIYNMRTILDFGAIINPENRDDWKTDNQGHAVPKRKTKKQKEIYKKWNTRNNIFTYEKLLNYLNVKYEPFGTMIGFYINDDYFLFTAEVEDSYKPPKNTIEITGSEYISLCKSEKEKN